MLDNIIETQSTIGISVETAFSLEDSTWIDVRCPREYLKGHYTRAINIPIFSDIEYEKLGKIYLDKNQNELALDIYNDLYKIDKNYKIALEISRILIDKEDYQQALDWAEIGVKNSGENGESLFQRAEVFFTIADACSGESLNFKLCLVTCTYNLKLVVLSGIIFQSELMVAILLTPS